jgi:hypothetical protein
MRRSCSGILPANTLVPNLCRRRDARRENAFKQMTLGWARVYAGSTNIHVLALQCGRCDQQSVLGLNELYEIAVSSAKLNVGFMQR